MNAVVRRRDKFQHECQPYGTVKLEDVELIPCLVPRYFPKEEMVPGYKVRGRVVSSRMFSQFGGVTIGSGQDRYETGKIIEEYVRYSDWERGYKVSVAM